ncbi:hypothetical protein [Vibrio splendidus]|uniref:hypothetical protein n=1 Tax=Vibrio splendidus TaxID=29497 RepID=UPI00036B1FD9|nr:hypothetical protein [Vibrio splendidus]OEF21039.1 hypothetical protein A145_04850 [Vibrio splendidus 5S-101]PMK36878.1 hypothetical protein BCU01_03600 [Vibrio splendidus]
MDTNDTMMGLTFKDERSVIGYYKSKNVQSPDELYALETLMIANIKGIPRVITFLLYPLLLFVVLMAFMKGAYLGLLLTAITIMIHLLLKFTVYRTFNKKLKILTAGTETFRRENGYNKV